MNLDLARGVLNVVVGRQCQRKGYNPRRHRMSLFDHMPGPPPGLAERRELNAALRQRQPHAPGTWVLLVVNVGIFIAMTIATGRSGPFSSKLLIGWGALFAPYVADGGWWRLFTATFLHGHALHVAFNMFALTLVGSVVERLLGTRTFLIFYVAAALTGSALSLWVHPITASVGASGAIMGLYGVLLAFMFGRESSPARTLEEPAPFVSRLLLYSHLPGAVPAVAATLLFGWFDGRADNAAHLGGFAAGCVFGWMAGRDIEWRQPSGQVAGIAVAVALGCCAVSLATQRDFIDARPALIDFFIVDSRATAQYSTLVNSRSDPGSITRTIEQEILPAFSRERARLESIGRVPSEQEQMLTDLRQYVLLRESYWRQRAAAGDRTDGAARQQLDAADHAADVVMRRLLAAR